MSKITETNGFKYYVTLHSLSQYHDGISDTSKNPKELAKLSIEKQLVSQVCDFIRKQNELLNKFVNGSLMNGSVVRVYRTGQNKPGVQYGFCENSEWKIYSTPTYTFLVGDELHLRLQDLSQEKCTQANLLYCEYIINNFSFQTNIDNLCYERELGIAKSIYGSDGPKKSFLKFDDKDCYQEEDLSLCESFPCHPDDDLIIYQSKYGYQCFGTKESLNAAKFFVSDTPILHSTGVTFKSQVLLVVGSPHAFMRNLIKDRYLLKEEENYQKLVWIYTNSKFNLRTRFDAQALLNTSHYFIYGERHATQAMVLKGPTGVGKSHAVQKLSRYLSFYSMTVNPKRKSFFDGYFGQSVIVFDDLGHQSKEEWLPLLQLVSPVDYMLPMANAEHIGVTPMVSSLIIITTNTIDKIKDLPPETFDAIMRRIRLLDINKTEFSYSIYRISMKRHVHCYTCQTSDLLAYLQMYTQESVIGKVEKSLYYYFDGLLQVIEIANSVYSFLSRTLNTVKAIWKAGRCIVTGFAGISSVVIKTISNIPRSFRSQVHKFPIEEKQYFREMISEKSYSERVKLVEEYIKLRHQSLPVSILDKPNTLNSVKKPEGYYKVRQSKGLGNSPLNYALSRSDDNQIGQKVYNVDLPPIDLQPYTHRVDDVENGRILYQLHDLPENLNGLYSTRVVSCVRKPDGSDAGVVFAPLHESLVTYKDNSGWRPNMPFEMKINHGPLNSFLHQRKNGFYNPPNATTSNHKTIKRRATRARAKASALNQSL